MSKRNQQSFQRNVDRGKELISFEPKKNSLLFEGAIHHTILNSSKFLCIATDMKGVIQLFNIGAELKLGYKAEEVINKLSIADISDPDELIERANKFKNEFKISVNTGFEALVFKASQGIEDLYSQTFICKNGNRLQFDVSVTARLDDQGKIVGYLVIGTENSALPDIEVLRKKIERQLIQYIKNASLKIFVADKKGNYVYVNKAASALTHYSRTELLKMNLIELVHTNDRDKAAESFKKLLELGNITLECYFLTKNKEERFWKVNAIKILEDRYLGIVNDMTDQKKSEEELIRTNKYLETIIENIPDMLYLKDAKDLNFVQINRAGEELTGFSREEMLGKNDYDFYPKEQAKFSRKKSREVLKAKSSLFIEEELIKTRYKGERILQTKKVPIINSEGKPEFLLGISEDITERKKADKELMDQKLELDNFFSSSTNLLCIADMDYSFRKLNLEWQKILGYTIEEIVLSKFNDFVHPDDAKLTMDALTLLSTEQPITNYRNRYRRKDGTYVWIEWHVRSTGNLIHASGQDINSKIFYEEQLKESKEAAEAANKAKSDFLANMSHEIRNPMNAIIGFAELLHNTIKDERLLSQVDSIRNSGKNLLGILNDILDLSKIEAGKMKLELEPVNLNFLLKDIENMFSLRVHEKGLSFCVEIDPEISMKLMLDEVRLRQILFNLIGNALKFTEKGYVCLSINKVFKSDTSIDLTIAIQDTGIGIPKEQQQLIFETFQQQSGQSTKKYGGTGLGLSISKRLAEMMGGKIMVISEPGKGSIFKVILYNVEIQHEKTSEIKEIGFEPNNTLFENAKVLIVDDSELNLNLIIMTLENSNLVLLTALNGEEAIEMTRKHHPDLILMDLRMPILNGYEAAQVIKSEDGTKSIPIIAISASADLEIKCNQSQSLFNDYLMKPIKLAELYELLKKYLPFKKVKIIRQAMNSFEVITEKEEITDLTDEQKSHLFDIINVLETEFLPINENVIKKQLIEHIDLFGKGLVSFGEVNSLSIITDYGKKICQHVDNFEIDNMMKTLKLFPDIIQKIKNIYRSEK